MDQNISALKAPTLAPDACREYMSDGHTTLGDWAAYVTNFTHTHEYLTAFIGAVILTGLSIAYVYIDPKRSGDERKTALEFHFDKEIKQHNCSKREKFLIGLLIVAFVGMFASYKVGYKNGYIDCTNEVVAEDSARQYATRCGSLSRGYKSCQ